MDGDAQGSDFVPRPGKWTVDAGTAEVLADANRPGAYLLAVDGVAQSYVDLLDPTYVEFGYVRLFAALVDVLAPAPLAPFDLVHVGGGAGTLARRITALHPSADQLVIEVDAALATGVEQRLGVAGFSYVIGDGRGELARLGDASADAVFTDAFVGHRVPPTLTTLEYLAVVRRVLRPAGWYAVNVADQQPFDYGRRVAATVAAAFESCLLIAEPAVLRGRRFGNLVVVGSDGDLPVDLLSRALAGDAASPTRLVDGDALRRFLDHAEPLRDDEAIASPTPPPGAFSIR